MRYKKERKEKEEEETDKTCDRIWPPYAWVRVNVIQSA